MSLNPTFVAKVLYDVKKLTPANELDYMELIALWTLLEAWMKSLGSFSSTAEALRHLRMTPNAFCDTYAEMDNNDFAQLLHAALAAHVMILPADVGKSNPLAPELTYFAGDNPEDVIALIYEIRNKMVHGDWQFDWSNNDLPERNLVAVAARVLEKWMNWANSQGVFG